MAGAGQIKIKDHLSPAEAETWAELGKNNKARLISDIFKPEVSGTDLKLALIVLMNLALESLVIPKELLSGRRRVVIWNSK